MNAHPLEHLYALWDQLGNVQATDEGCIDEQFLHFEGGTDFEEIWHWFEDQNEEFCVGEVMEGIRK